MEGEEQPQDARRRLGEQLLDRDEVLQTFRHLEPLNVDMPCVDEVVHRLTLRLGVVGLVLSELILVVWIFQIDATEVNVNRVAEKVA